MKKITSTIMIIAFLCTSLLSGISVYAATPETISDASVPSDLANIGTPYTDNFTKNLLNLFTYDGAHNLIIENDESIAGKSFKFDINPAFFSGVYAFGINNMMVAGGKYRVKVDYKVTSETMPPNFYIGFKNDIIGDQINRTIDFSGKTSNTVYTYQYDYTLLNNASYYMQMFCYNPQSTYGLVIDNLSIERLYVGESFYQETTSDSSTLNDLSKVGVPFTENFTKGAIGSFYSYDMNHFSTIQDESAIAGKSILLDFTAATFGGVYIFGTKNKLVGGGTYRLSLDYKYLTDTAPSGMYFGFTRDGGLNQKNVNVDFSGKTKNTTYNFTADYSLEDFNDYYFQWFNLTAADGSKLVIDSISITLLGTETTESAVLSNMSKIGVPFTENFTANVMNMWSYDLNHFSVVEGSQAIFGKSLVQNFTNAGFGGIYGFATKFNFVTGGTYRLSAKYKVLTDVKPSGFYFGFKNDSGDQKNVQVDFTGNVKDAVYTFSADYVLGSFNDYYLQWFNVSNNDGSIISIDSIRIELLDTPSHYTMSYPVSAGNLISGLAVNTNTAAFLSGVQRKNGAGVVVKLYKSAIELGALDAISTGTSIEITNAAGTVSYKAVVKGDLNGDAVINVSDLAAQRSHLLKSNILANEFEAAGDFSGDSTISISDLLMMKKQLLSAG